MFEFDLSEMIEKLELSCVVTGSFALAFRLKFSGFLNEQDTLEALQTGLIKVSRGAVIWENEKKRYCRIELTKSGQKLIEKIEDIPEPSLRILFIMVGLSPEISKFAFSQKGFLLNLELYEWSHMQTCLLSYDMIKAQHPVS